MEANTEGRQYPDLSNVLKLGKYAADFAGVERATRHADGRPENDSEHSYMLAKLAVHLAHEHYPNLDDGKVAKMGLIHDIPEVITGDTPTFGISPEARIAKEAKEAEATEFLVDDLPSPWGQTLAQYEQQDCPEARFVRLVDKLMPSLMHIYGDGRGTFKDNYGITNKEDFWKMRGDRSEELRELYPEFPKIHDLSDELIEHALEIMWGK